MKRQTSRQKRIDEIVHMQLRCEKFNQGNNGNTSSPDDIWERVVDFEEMRSNGLRNITRAEVFDSLRRGVPYLDQIPTEEIDSTPINLKSYGAPSLSPWAVTTFN